MQVTDVPFDMTIQLTVNGEPQAITVDVRTSLLDLLRERLQLTGTKKGCDHGQCGACTVHVNGRRVTSCLTLAVMHDGDEITTIEGLGTPDTLHPMQAAFVACDAYQCGYCTSGQIMSAVALLKEPCGPDDAAVKELMSGNICRCGTDAPPGSKASFFYGVAPRKDDSWRRQRNLPHKSYRSLNVRRTSRTSFPASLYSTF